MFISFRMFPATFLYQFMNFDALLERLCSGACGGVVLIFIYFGMFPHLLIVFAALLETLGLGGLGGRLVGVSW